MKTRKSVYYQATHNPNGEYKNGHFKYTFTPHMGYLINGTAFEWEGNHWRCTDIDSGLLIKSCYCNKQKAILEISTMELKIEAKKQEMWIQKMIEDLQDFLSK